MNRSAPRLEAPPIFVLGHPHSGTTWLRQLLERHPRLASSRESHLFDRYLASFFDDREKWIRHWVDQRRLDELLRALVIGIFQAALERAGKARIVEKTPTHRFWMPEIRRLFPESIIIHCFRDGRDVAISLLTRRRRSGEQWIPPGITDCAKTWQRSIQMVEETGKQLPGEAPLAVRYEELVAQPHRRLQLLLEEIGEEASEAVVQEIVAARPALPEQVEKWRRTMSPEDQRRFVSAAGSTLQKLGYPLE